MKGLNLKTLTPHLIAVFIFVVLSIGYFSPAILEGKKLSQHDIITGQGMQKEITDFRDQYGKEPLWTNSMFSGMPAFQISVKYFSGFLFQVRSIFELWLPEPASHLMLYLIGFYILMIVLGVSPWVAIAGSIAFCLSSYYLIIIGAGHIWKVRTIALLAPTLAGIIMTYRGEWLKGGVITALFLTLQIYSNHLQMTYYFFIMVGIMSVYEFFYRLKEKELPHFLKAIATLFAAAILAIGVNITQIYTTYEYGEFTIRGKSELTFNQENKTGGLDRDYVTGWSYGTGESWSFMIPNAKGGASGYLGENTHALNKVDPEFRETIARSSHYWGDQPGTSGPVYMGASVVFLFILGLFILRWRYKWALVITAALVIMLSWGKNFMGLTNLFLDYFPLYNKFRAVSSILIIAELIFPLIAFLTVKELMENKEPFRKYQKQFYLAFGITGGLALLFYLLPSAFFNFISQNEISQFDNFRAQNPGSGSQIDSYIGNLESARIAIFKADALRSFLFIAVTAGLIWFFAVKKIKAGLLTAALTLIVLFDLGLIAKRYLGNENFVPKKQAEQPFTATPADQQILADKDPNFRVMNLTVSTFNDASTSYFHKSIGGYHGAKLQRYQDLIEYHISQNNISVLNMLNTKYVIVQDDNKQPQARVNPGALGNAWFVQSVRWVNNADEEIVSLNDFNPAKEAIVDIRFEDQLTGFIPVPDSTASIRQKSYLPNHLTYESNTETSQLAVFSEIYYPAGWNAYIDDKPASHFRVNYVLRAMIIPAGSHTIEFKFEPQSFYTGEKISIASSVMLGLIIIAGLFLHFRKKE
jgi:hypothetical protein